MLKILLKSQIEQVGSLIDERVLTHIRRGQVNKFESYSELNLISFDWYDVLDLTKEHSQIIIYFTKEYLFFICEDERSYNLVKNLVKEESLNERTLYLFFSELIKDDIEHLEELEERITETEDELLTASRKTYAPIIITYRKELMRLKKYYEQLNRIFEGLTENENSLISKDDLRYFRILDNKIDRLFLHVLNLRDYVTQVREAYQAQIDIEQNKLMRVFTVVTSIFMPLTLVVGWYGMNLQMPEFKWKYAYLAVIVLCVVITLFCISFFRRKKWF